jgi:hypothetical protein
VVEPWREELGHLCHETPRMIYEDFTGGGEAVVCCGKDCFTYHI